MYARMIAGYYRSRI